MKSYWFAKVKDAKDWAGFVPLNWKGRLFNPGGNSPPLFKAGMRADSRNKVSGQSLAPTALEIVSSTPVKAWESN